MSNLKLTEKDEAFLDAMAMLMAPWGWPRPVGRIYAYLLLREDDIRRLLSVVRGKYFELPADVTRHAVFGTASTTA